MKNLKLRQTNFNCIIPLLPALIGGAASLIGSAMSNATNKKIANQNLESQKEQQSWDRQAQQITWNREDNAVQRRVADLTAAGLSPVLAAGSAAETSAPIRSQAPQNEWRPNYAADIAGAMAMAQSVAQYKLTEAQTDKITADKLLDREKFEEQKNEFQQGHALEREKLASNVDIAEKQLGLGQANLTQRQIEHRENLALAAETLGFNKYKFQEDLKITLERLAIDTREMNRRADETYLHHLEYNLAESRERDLQAMRSVDRALTEIQTELAQKKSNWTDVQNTIQLAQDIKDLLRTSRFSKWIWE